MKISHVLIGAVSLLLSALPGAALSEDSQATSRPLVTFFYAGASPGDSWTRTNVDIARSAAEDLGVDFEIVFTGLSRKEMIDAVNQRIEDGRRPDYALVVDFRGGVDYILEYLDDRGIDAFLIYGDLPADAARRIGEPREKLEHWIGKLIPDDQRAGYDLATYLFEQARPMRKGKPIRAIGISGSYANTAAIKRNRGLELAATENSDVDLKQVVTARWVPSLARQKYELLQNRYGKFDVVWVANDAMALSILDAIDPSTETVIVGGMDWTESARDAIAEGRMAASMGGHILDMGYVIAILKQHHLGCDFAEGPAGASLSSRLTLLTQNDTLFNEIIETGNWDALDFSVIDCEMVQSDDFDGLSIEKIFADIKNKNAGG